MVYSIQDELEFANRYADEGGVIIDVRNADDQEEVEMPQFVRLDLFNQNFSEYFTALKRDIPILIFCNERSRSRGALRLLQDLGFERLYQLKRNI